MNSENGFRQHDSNTSIEPAPQGQGIESDLANGDEAFTHPTHGLDDLQPDGLSVDICF